MLSVPVRLAKVALFRALFAGHDDVHAMRWENLRTEKSGWGPAVVGGWPNARKPGREYVPLSGDVDIFARPVPEGGLSEGVPVGPTQPRSPVGHVPRPARVPPSSHSAQGQPE